ncbi:ATP phosphoribosyltransferase [Tessaracoccus lapidicaptus]|uniref:ATP phosphoribosyltransferase n=1 Tax=Tessaracoccus lapidicaptus TaxID=1427523 RepID=A0A1C0AGI8_9ACTN|nr:MULTISPECIES: ATP phosphoribosyltransferase [Tessaracoccus]AQX14941.1 ATP phosphoribosyltransferase [Tessaracoccus sp. T2.5-30]OCL30845.1 ATP phosphoribosyltransferase [Tessaracoccus lapidicaptus]VEP39105.1 ATP phosphoribosyltransferase [Tessaracoccus lapidicaptus]
MSTERLLRIAVPNKGALAEPAAAMLRAAGYRQRTDAKDLTLIDADHGVEFYYLRPRDIAVYIGRGHLDVGITGRDMLLDSGAEAIEMMALGFGGSRFRFAAPGGSQLTVADVAGKRVATSYPGLLEAYLDERGISAEMVKLDGAVESAIRLGVADVVADVVDTGTTLKRAGLELFGDAICTSEAVLIRRADAELPPGVAGLETRLTSVLVAQNYLMMDYNVEQENLAETIALAPGVEGPTVSTLAKDGWSAVRVLVPREGAHLLMDRLYDAGARGILLTELAACRL